MTPAKPFRFTAENFRIDDQPLYPFQAADIANFKLAAHLATLTKLHAYKDMSSEHYYASDKESPDDTHTITVWTIEPVKPKVCKHEPADFVIRLAQIGNGVSASPMFACKHCSAKLTPTWSADE